MKKFCFLLATAGIIFAACVPNGSYDGGFSEQPGNNDPQQDEITLMVEISSVPSYESEFFITVTSNCDWRASDDSSWITNVTKSGSAGTNKLEFKILDNPYTHEREGHIVVTNSDRSVSKTLTLIQEAHKEEFVPSIEVDVDTSNYIEYEYKGGERRVTITANIDYIVESPCDWLTYTETASGITISIAANDTGEYRLGNIMIWNPEYSQYESASKIISISQNPARYKIGDIVTKNGGKGVVYCIDSSGFKMVSITEQYNLQWSTENIETGASNSYNGAKNMAKIQSISGWKDKYPAFAWCADYGEGWYLPAYYELKEIIANREIINQKTQIGNISVVIPISEGYHWTSDEHNADRGRLIEGKSNDYYTAPKQNHYYVRAIYAWDE